MKALLIVPARRVRGFVAVALMFALGQHIARGEITFVSGDYYGSSLRTITQYDPSGAITGSFNVPSALADEVHGLAFGPDGLLYASVALGTGFNILAYDASGTLRQTYSGNVGLAGNSGYGKLTVDYQHIYLAGQNQLTRFDLGNPNSGVSIYQNNQVFDVDLMPDGNLLALSAYYLDEISPSGSLIRRLPVSFTDARGVEYDPATGKLFVTEFGYTGFNWQLMRLNWATGAMEASTFFWYGQDICLTQSGNLLVGSSATTPAFFDQNLTQVGTLGSGTMFVTQYVPEPTSGVLIMIGGLTLLWTRRALAFPLGSKGVFRG